MDTVNQLTAAFEATWTWATFIAAVLAGLGLGYVLIGRFAVDPTYANPALTALQIGRLVFGAGLICGLVFYVGQSVASAADGDPGWARIVSRYGLWMVYSACLGVGAWWRVHDHLRLLRLSAHVRAEREIANGSK